MANVSYLQFSGNQIFVNYDNGARRIAEQLSSDMFIVRNGDGLKYIRTQSNLFDLMYSDGSQRFAYPTPTDVWYVGPGGSGPGPGGGLLDYYTNVWGISGDWEEHASYSQGGTDWPMPNGTGIRAPAAGTLVNYGNTDGAGLKSILIFDQTYPRILPASNTLMNGWYRETDAGDAPAASFVAQHLQSQMPEGHYNQGDVFVISNNTGSSTGPHLHAQLLAGTTIDDRRMDFMKFKTGDG